MLLVLCVGAFLRYVVTLLWWGCWCAFGVVRGCFFALCGDAVVVGLLVCFFCVVRGAVKVVLLGCLWRCAGCVGVVVMLLGCLWVLGVVLGGGRG